MKQSVYDRPDAERLLFDEAPEIPRPDSSWFAAAMAGDASARPGWSANRAENLVILAQARYAERRAAAGGEDAARWAAVAERLRDDVAGANLALVLSVVSRHSTGDFEDRVSCACAALANAIRCFDPLRGFAFSTYATVAMRQALYRRTKKRVPLCAGEEILSLGDGDRALAAYRESRREAREEERAERLRDAVVRAGLTPDERHVLSRRVGAEGRPPSFETIGRELGLTKERARQVHEGALAKVRAAYEGPQGRSATAG